MGIERLSLNRDYAAEFMANTKAAEQNKAKINEIKMTNPVAPQNKVQADLNVKISNRKYKAADMAMDINFDRRATVLKHQRVYTSKNAIKAAEEDVKKKYLEYGAQNGQKLTEKEAEQFAKAFVENEVSKEKFLSTRTFLDKDEYEAAELKRKEQKELLLEKYKNEGLSKKEAEQKAEANLVKNDYIRNKDAREFIEQNKEAFFDERGRFSQSKFKAFTKTLMNASTGKDESENYHLGLKERRELAGKFGIHDDAICDMVNRSGGAYEKDYTKLIRGGALATAVGIGSAVGALLSTSAAAAAAAATPGAAAAGAGAAAVNVVPAGAAAGAGIGFGLASLIKDPGGKETKVVPPNEPVLPEPPESPVEPPVQNPPVQNPPEAPCQLQPDELLEETCEYTLKKGQTLYDAVRDGYNLKTHKEIIKFVHAIKDRYDIKYTENTPRQTWEMPELYGKKFNCDVKVKGTMTKPPVKQNGSVGNFSRNDLYWFEDCDGNRTYAPSREKRDEVMKKKQAEINAAA